MFSPATTDINPEYLGNRMKRLLAFCIDIFPINFIAITIYRQFSDYDTVMESFIADPNDEELKAAMMAIMNKIGMIGGGFYLIYCFLMEASVNQATFGKQLMRLKVVSIDGSILTPKEAFWRNAFKIISHAVMSIGFFWIFFDRQKRGWHDIMGKTFVVDKNYASEIPQDLTEQLEQIKDQPYRNTASTLASSNFHSLTEGNQSNLLYPADISLEDFKLIKSNNADPAERLGKYQYQLNDYVLSSNTDIPDDLVWNNSTYGQKLLRVFTVFDSHMTAYDLFSFLFHSSEFTFAMVDVLKEIKAKELLPDYMEVVKEFGQKMDIFTENRKTYQYPLSSKTDKDNALSNVKSALILTEPIDHYYNTVTFRQDFYLKVCDYIESNPHMFIRTHS